MTKNGLLIRNTGEFPLLPFLVTQMRPHEVSDLCTFLPWRELTIREGPSWHRGTNHYCAEILTLDKQCFRGKILIQRGEKWN